MLAIQNLITALAAPSLDWVDAAQQWLPGPAAGSLVATLGAGAGAPGVAELSSQSESIEFDAPYELSYVIDEQARLSWSVDPRQARDLHLQALMIRREARLRTTYVDSLDALAGLEATVDNHAEAVRLLAVSEAGRSDIGYPRPPVDEPVHQAPVDTLRTCLGRERFDDLWQQATDVSMDDAVAVLTRGRGPRQRPASGWESLTPTELEVVQLVSAGLSNPEIAARLYVSRSTVKAHLARIYTKAGVSNRTELATRASAELARDNP